MANFNFNKVILGGRLIADPELKQTPSGVSVCSFTIAVNRRYTKPEEQPQSDFFNVTSWRGNAELISKYFHKGSAICICGSLRNRSWTDNEGKKHYSTEIVADEVNFVDSKGNSDQTSAPKFSAPETPQFEEIADDSDLPF